MRRSGSLGNVNCCEDGINELNAKFAAMKKENKCVKFANSQIKAQMRKVQLDNIAKTRRLREIQDCAACDCLQTRRRRGFNSSSICQKQVAQVKDIDVERHKPATNVEIHPNRNDLLKIGRQRETELLNEIEALRNRLRNSERYSGDHSAPGRFQNSYDGPHGGFSDASSLQSQIAQLQKTNQQLSTRIRETTSQMTKEKSLFDKGTSSLKAIISELNKRIANFETALDGAKNENRRLLVEMDQLRSSLRGKTANFAEITQRIAQLEHLNRQLEAQLAQSKGREKDLLAEMQYYKAVEAADDLIPKVGFDEGQRKFRDYNPFCPVCKALKRPSKSMKAIASATNEGNQDMVLGEDVQEIERLRNELEICKAELETSKSHQPAIDLNDENRRLRTQIQILERDLTKLRNGNEQFAAKLKFDELGVNPKVAERIEHQNAVVDLKLKLQDAKTTRDGLEAKLKDSTHALNEMNLVLQRYQRDLAEAEAEKLRLRAKVDRQPELEKMLQERNFEIERLANAIATIEIEYDRFRRGLSEQEATALRLQKDLEVANSLRSDVEKSKEIVLETNQRLRNEMQALSVERDALRSELNHLNSEFDATKHRLQQYVGEVRDLERILSQKTTERTVIFSDEFHASTLKPSTSRDEEITRLKAENTMLIEQQSVLNTKIDDVQQLLTQIQAAIEQSHAEREQLIVEKRVLAAELDDRKAQLANADTKIETLNAQLDQLKSQIL